MRRWPAQGSRALRMRSPWEKGTDESNRDARDLRARQPLMATCATRLSPKTKLDQGVRLNWRLWVEGMARSADELSQLTGGRE